MDTQLKLMEKWVHGRESLAIERTTVAVALAHFYLKQGAFSKALQYANFAGTREPAMQFTFRLIEVMGMSEDIRVEGEQLPFAVMGRYYALRALQKDKIFVSQQTMAASTSSHPNELIAMKGNELLQLLETCRCSGLKAVQIRQYAQNCVNGTPYVQISEKHQPQASSTHQKGRKTTHKI